MQFNRFYFITLLVFVVILGYLCYQIFKPFLSPIAWAIVLSIVFYPVFELVNKYIKWKSVASLLTLFIILLIIIGPFSYISFMIVLELKALPKYLAEDGMTEISRVIDHPYIKGVTEKIMTTLNVTAKDIEKSVLENVTRFGKELMDHFTKGIGNIVAVTVNFAFMTIALFFMLKDGVGFLRNAMGYLPFSEEQKDRLASQTKDVIVSTIYGGVVVAIIQGSIGGIAFYFLGISSPALWGLAISIASFIPLIGTFGIWGPMTVYLLISGEILHGIILALVGVFIISMVDNILKPIIIGGRTKMPVLLIFFSVLGGLKLFGLIGLIMGPLVVAIFVSVLDIFRNIEGGNNA